MKIYHALAACSRPGRADQNNNYRTWELSCPDDSSALREVRAWAEQELPNWDSMEITVTEHAPVSPGYYRERVVQTISLQRRKGSGERLGGVMSKLISKLLGE